MVRWRDIKVEAATPDEIAAIKRGASEIARGEFVTLEQLRRDLLSPSGVDRAAHPIVPNTGKISSSQ